MNKILICRWCVCVRFRVGAFGEVLCSKIVIRSCYVVELGYGI